MRRTKDLLFVGVVFDRNNQKIIAKTKRKDTWEAARKAAVKIAKAEGISSWDRFAIKVE